MICDTCNNKKVCKVYETIFKVMPDTVVIVSSCRYFNNNSGIFVSQQQFGNRHLENVQELSNKIKSVSKKKIQDAPQTINSLRGTGMNFVIDDNPIS